MKEIFPLSDGRLKSVRDTSRTNSDDDHRRNFPSSVLSLSDLASVGIDNHPPLSGMVVSLSSSLRPPKCSQSLPL